MRSLFEEKQLYLVGGPGGVGKTTLAAALGVRLAMAGYKTVVLTVDPARRLAQALGFENFKAELQPVEVPGGGKGSLHASMLDTQRYFDKLIERFATRPEQRDRILNNPMYRITIDSLGGTHEYAAMERLLEFANDPRFERVVVDTPPSQNAVDLLSAPQRLADFMDNSVLKWFQGGRAYLQLFRTGTKLALKLIRRVFGAEFLDAFAKFMDDLEGMQAGFRSRNLEVLRLLKSPRTAFCLVTYPSEQRYQESVEFLKTLAANEIPLAALVLNRVEPPCPTLAELETGNATAVGRVLGGLDSEGRKGLEEFLSYAHALGEQQQRWIEEFRKLGPRDASGKSTLPTFLVERQGNAPTDVATLSQLADFLLK